MIRCHSVFSVWPKTILILPVWPRDNQRLDMPAYPVVTKQQVGLYCSLPNRQTLEAEVW